MRVEYDNREFHYISNISELQMMVFISKSKIQSESKSQPCVGKSKIPTKQKLVGSNFKVFSFATFTIALKGNSYLTALRHCKLVVSIR